jgi:hypothetical protein
MVLVAVLGEEDPGDVQGPGVDPQTVPPDAEQLAEPLCGRRPDQVDVVVAHHDVELHASPQTPPQRGEDLGMGGGEVVHARAGAPPGAGAQLEGVAEEDERRHVGRAGGGHDALEELDECR